MLLLMEIIQLYIIDNLEIKGGHQCNCQVQGLVEEILKCGVVTTHILGLIITTIITIEIIQIMVTE